MTFAAEAGFYPVGGVYRQFSPLIAALSNTLIDATNEDCIMYGQLITSDGASHTLDTGGTIGLRFGAVTSANAGTTVKIGIGDLLNAAAAPPARANHVADVITFDCSKTLTGAGIITATAWTDFTPDTGSKVIANNQLVAVSVQMTALGGADAFNVQTAANPVSGGNPGVTGFLGGVYTDQTRLPNAFITFADGAFAWFAAGQVLSVTATQTWNSGSVTKEYGNIVRFSAPKKAYGITMAGSLSNDNDLVLYSAPLSGSPVAEKTVSITRQNMALTGSAVHTKMFDTPFDLLAGVDYMVASKPTTATNNTLQYITMNSTNHQRSQSLGINAYAANRASGAFASQNSGLDRYSIGLLVSGGDTGGGGGYPASRVLTGM